MCSARSRGRCQGPHPGPRGSMVKIVSGGSKVGLDSVSIVCVAVGLEGACRAPERELKLANTHFSRFYYLPDSESAYCESGRGAKWSRARCVKKSVSRGVRGCAESYMSVEVV